MAQPSAMERVAHGEAGSAWGRRVWRRALVAGALSLVIPGTGHLYLGRTARGLVWSAIYLLLVFPGALLTCVAFPTPGFHALGWAAFLLGGFLAFVATGAALSALGRGGRRGTGAPAVQRPRLWVLESYAALVVLAMAGEASWLLAGGVTSARVRTRALEPLAAPGDSLFVLCSRHARPVHGEIVLLTISRPPGSSQAPGGSEQGGLAPREPEPIGLGRVIARPGDTVAAEVGELRVNGLLLDLGGPDQRRDLEKAGRAERRRRLVSLLPFVHDAPPPPVEVMRDGLRWGCEQTWGPFVLPQDALLVLPDREESLEPCVCGSIVSRTDILGRAIE